MTREQALSRCAELNRNEPSGYNWFVRTGSRGTWEVVSAHVKGFDRPSPFTATAEARSRPELAPDPRPSLFRNIPPYGAGV
jgi:hypothetical protein